jgi:hypothetical protein
MIRLYEIIGAKTLTRCAAPEEKRIHLPGEWCGASSVPLRLQSGSVARNLSPGPRKYFMPSSPLWTSTARGVSERASSCVPASLLRR